MKVIKRSGKEVDFDRNKISTAISKANAEAEKINAKLLTKDQIESIALKIEDICKTKSRATDIEEIQTLVENELIYYQVPDIARLYIRYRYNHELIRESNSTDATILTLINGDNEVIKQENSNKNPTILSTQRDYMAGETSKDLTKRFLLPPDIWEAHENGLIHFHKKIVA